MFFSNNCEINYILIYTDIIYKVYQKPTNFKVLHTYEHFLQTSYTRKCRKTTTTKAATIYKQLKALHLF